MNTSDRHPLLRLRTNALPRRAGWLAAAIGVVVAGAAGAAPTLRTIEECIESGTRAVSLPSAASGSLSASPCTGCPTLRLQFDAATVYLVGKQQVTYAKFREIAAKDDLRLDVFYKPQTRVLTRLRVPAVGNGQ
jgi:hypothetical protein